MTLTPDLLSTSHQAADQPLPLDDAGKQGFSLARLKKLGERYQAGVAAHEIPGAVVMIARNGKVVYGEAFGYADQPAGVPMTVDTVFALASMTKPITSVAAMILVEEGRIGLDEPLSRYLPELTGLQVLTERIDDAGTLVQTLEPAERDPTVQDLMRHTSGFIYGQFGSGPLHRTYMEANVWSVNFDVPLAETVTRLSKLPLGSQPGSTFDYSVSTDVLGRIIEVVSGHSLDHFIRDRIALPLKLETLKFHVDAGAPLAWDPLFAPSTEAGAPQVSALRAIVESRIHREAQSLSGGAGMFGTAGDYLRFAQMLLNRGQLEGTRILSAKSVELMTSNHLAANVAIPQNIRSLLRLITPSSEMGQGFGLGFAVRTAAGRNPAPGSIGDFYWAGASGVYFWVDPEQQLICLSMTAQSRFDTKVLYRQLIRQLVYQALEHVYPATATRVSEEILHAKNSTSAARGPSEAPELTP